MTIAPDITTSPSLCDVVERLNITYRQADHWIRSGYVLPHLRDHGTGHFRHLEPTDAVVLAVMAQLVTAGIPPAQAGELAPQFVADPSAELRVGAVGISISWSDL